MACAIGLKEQHKDSSYFFSPQGKQALMLLNNYCICSDYQTDRAAEGKCLLSTVLRITSCIKATC